MSNSRTLRAVEAFVTVVDQQGFTSAASELRTSTAAVSRAIKELEEQLGVKLLNRTTRRIGLTEEGAKLYAECQRGLSQLQRALSAARGSRSEARGLLRVSCPEAFGRRYVVPAALDFRALHPEIQLDLTLSDGFVDLIDQRVDIAVRGGHLADSRLISRTLAPMPLYVCASPATIRRRGRPVAPADLAASECIRFRFKSTGKELAWEFVQDGSTFAVNVNGSLALDDIESACLAAVAGYGFAQLPGYIALPHIRSGSLVPVLLDFVDQSRQFTLTYVNRTDAQPLRERLFLQHVAGAMSDTSNFQLRPEEMHKYMEP